MKQALVTIALLLAAVLAVAACAPLALINGLVPRACFMEGAGSSL